MSSGFQDAIKQQIEKSALKYAVENRLKYGEAKQGPVMNKVLGEFKEFRHLAREIAGIVANVVKHVNSLSDSELKDLAEKLSLTESRESRKEERVLPPLPNVDKWKNVVTRFAPNPDFPIHLGNARAAILSHEYAKMYKGKFILRFEDTDPRTKPPLPFSYTIIEDDLKWLGVLWDEKYVQSMRMEKYYSIAKKLIELGYAYIDLCKSEVFKEYRNAGKACPHRDLSPEQHLELFEKIFAGEFGEGEAVIRIKTDLNHPDPAIRDWVMFRIIDTSKNPHPVTGDKYRLWPTYNFAAAVDDYLLGVSHILRGKEHALNTAKQVYIYKYLGWKYPEVVNFGRVGLEGLILSKTWIKNQLKMNPEKFTGFDDIRFATISSLRRRGVLPETIREIILGLGLSPVDAKISWVNLAAINRKNVDPIAKRVFVVCNPIKLHLEGVKTPVEVEIPYHPSKDLGKRKIMLTKPEVWISIKDVENMKRGVVIRLMELFNIVVKEQTKDYVIAYYHSNSLEEARKHNASIIQWSPCEQSTKVDILRAEGMRLKRERCVGEQALKTLKEGEIIQMVRLGFGKIEKIQENKITIIYTHE
ncbi:glutamate--tRNA ligase [Ignisphaera sp. 4213-co]|uniref:Glutamate--tRNA ligase n=1 Tax=Ignisphaera cupida TaxID=3050454 RepID=A0ABD4Z5J2_9CREN|nr:glutamate--tRNA ligase [Ignisphaera sp. 4213-co]MDK6028561.1 glutamate--tRNA ligase [Ignisphaera sp. 4213-co]